MSIEKDIIDGMTEKMDNEDPRDTNIPRCGHCPSGVGIDHGENHEWHRAFKMPDTDNPNHIFEGSSDTALCGVSSESLGVLSPLFTAERETLLHPGKRGMDTPDRYCQTCLDAFQAQYDFSLSANELSCPECGSHRKVVIDFADGLTGCKGCGWNR